jgi:hypothetical protein
MAKESSSDPHLRDSDYTPDEQAEWDEQSEHERVADVTGVGPYDTEESESDE